MKIPNKTNDTMLVVEEDLEGAKKWVPKCKITELTALCDMSYEDLQNEHDAMDNPKYNKFVKDHKLNIIGYDKTPEYKKFVEQFMDQIVEIVILKQKQCGSLTEECTSEDCNREIEEQIDP